MSGKTMTPEEKIALLEKRVKSLEENGGKKRRRVRDPNAEPRPLSEYQVFMKDAITHIKKDHPDMNHREAFKQAVSKWNAEKAKKSG